MIANKATNTPRLLSGPISLIKNIGGFAQVLPTAITATRIYGPVVIAGILQFIPLAATS